MLCALQIYSWLLTVTVYLEINFRTVYEAVSEPEAETLMLRSKHGICHICHTAPPLPSLQPVQCTIKCTMYTME